MVEKGIAVCQSHGFVLRDAGGGVEVSRILPHGPMGLQKGDGLIAVDGHSVTSSEDAMRRLEGSIGSAPETELEVSRGEGRVQEIMKVLMPCPQEKVAEESVVAEEKPAFSFYRKDRKESNTNKPDGPSTPSPSPPAPAAPEASPAPEPSEAEKEKTLGNQAFKDSLWDDAIKHFTAAIDLAPQPVPNTYYSNRAAAYLQAGKAKEALVDAVKSTEGHPDFAKGHYRAGQALLDLGRNHEAVAALNRARMCDPNNVQIYGALSRAQAALAAAKKTNLKELFPANQSVSELPAEVAASLVHCLVETYLRDSASTDAISARLRAVCPGLYTAEDSTSSKVLELLLAEHLQTYMLGLEADSLEKAAQEEFEAFERDTEEDIATKEESKKAKEDRRTEIKDELVSKPYVDMTIGLMKKFGVNVQEEELSTDKMKPRPRYTVKGGQKYVSPGTYYVEGDASSASYFIGGAAITGGPITIMGCGSESVQGDVKFAHAIEKMGATIDWKPNSMTVSRRMDGSQPLKGVDIDCGEIPDAAMTLATVALFAEGQTAIRNVYNWRVKETERMKAICTELEKLGAKVEEGHDFCIVQPMAQIGRASCRERV